MSGSNEIQSSGNQLKLVFPCCSSPEKKDKCNFPGRSKPRQAHCLNSWDESQRTYFLGSVLPCSEQSLVAYMASYPYYYFFNLLDVISYFMQISSWEALQRPIQIKCELNCEKRLVRNCLVINVTLTTLEKLKV